MSAEQSIAAYPGDRIRSCFVAYPMVVIPETRRAFCLESWGDHG